MRASGAQDAWNLEHVMNSGALTECITTALQVWQDFAMHDHVPFQDLHPDLMRCVGTCALQEQSMTVLRAQGQAMTLAASKTLMYHKVRLLTTREEVHWCLAFRQ